MEACYISEQESQEQQKKTDGQSSAMPDYAVGLLAPTSLDVGSHSDYYTNYVETMK